MKRTSRSRIGSACLTAFLIWGAVGVPLDWLLNDRPPAPRAADQCTPDHHWVYIGAMFGNGDLSCERDR